MNTQIKRILLCVILISTFGTALFAQITSSVKLPGHPRLLLLKGEEEKIRCSIAKDEIWQGVHRQILLACDTIINQPPVERIKIGKRLLDKSQEAERRIFYLSYAFRMTHNEKYLKRAEKELLAISGFSDWNPSHFLDVAEMTMAAAIGYDWLYDDLSENSRSTIKAAILKNGLDPSMNTTYNTFWLTAIHNWNQVCNGGIAFGALAVFEDYPDLSSIIINRAIKTIHLPMKEYGPDGTYPEGYSYWGYGTTFNVLFLSALDSAFGTDFGLTDISGFLKTPYFMQNLSGTTGKAFNFFDSGAESNLNTAMFWFAAKLKDPSLLWVEKNHLSDTQISGNRVLPALMIWGHKISMNKVQEPKTLMWEGKGLNPLAMMRTSWTDSEAIYVGMKGGSPGLNHGHMDVGSFVMDAEGERWAMDFGAQSYESLESKGIDLWNMRQNSQRWQVFRYNNFAHNTLTINGELQCVDGSAPILAYSDDVSFMNAIVDLSSVYKGSVAKANRGIAIVNKSVVVVRDEIETAPKETKVKWNMLTSAEVKILSGNKAELTQNGKKLILQVQEPAKIEMKTWSTQSPNTFDASNQGTTFVGFEVTLPAASKATLTVLLVPEKSINKVVSIVKPLQQWPH